MYNKLLATAALLCCFSFTLKAQSTISGRVTDSSNNLPLEYATVSIKDPKNGLYTGTVTNHEGRYIIEDLKSGRYTVIFNYIGYKTDSIDILIGNLNKIYNLGEKKLQQDAILVGEVTVTGRTDLVSSKLNKQTYNIDSNLSQAGGSVLEAMRNLPGVTIDKEGKVLLRGSDKVLVLINGRQSSLTGFGSQKGLDNISASNIDKIEVVNNPSAKYDAQGMAGMINIIYKKEVKTGFNGDASFNFGIGELSSRKANLPNMMKKYAFNPKFNPSINLNYRTEKVNVFLQSSGMIRKKLNSNEFSYRSYKDETQNITSQFLENRTQQQYDIRLGMDWFLTNNDQITIFGLFEDEYHIDKGHVPYDYSLNGKRKRFWSWAEDERTWAMNYNVNYRHKFLQPGHQIDASFTYKHGVENELFPFADSSAVRTGTDETKLIAKEKIVNFEIDYVKPLFSGRLEVGAKVQLRSIPISYNIFPGENTILDTQLGNWSKYNEDIYAIYANYLYESQYIDIEAGLRAENASINYKIDRANIYYNKDESYHTPSLFPNIRFTYKINDRNKLSLFYNRRVDRPGEFDLRPFPKYDDPELLKTGNPYLRPQFAQLFEFAYKTSWHNGSFYMAGYYKHINDLFTRIYTTSTNNPELINAVTQNLGTGRNYGTELILEQNITPKWDFNASFNWYRNVINAFSGTIYYPVSQPFEFNKKSGNTWNLKVNTSLQLPKEIDLQASYIYYAPDITPQGRIDSRGSFDLGIRKKALKGKLEFTLSATDILNTFGIKETINSDHVSIRKENYYETQVVTVGAKFKF